MQDSGYLIPSATHRNETVISRSRFITTIAHTPTVQDAREFIDAMRAEFPDANHNCWAYVTGPPGDTASIGMSDAGEPHGTAGRPMLDVLLHSGIGEIAAVVTRYFGGTKLGTGGLVKAYGGAVQEALVGLDTRRRVIQTHVRVRVPYADVEMLRRSLAEVDAEISVEEYTEVVMYEAAVPFDRLDEFRKTLADRTAGRAVVDTLQGAAGGTRPPRRP